MYAKEISTYKAFIVTNQRNVIFFCEKEDEEKDEGFVLPFSTQRDFFARMFYRKKDLVHSNKVFMFFNSKDKEFYPK